MDTCPERFRLNCIRYEIECDECGADKGDLSKPLLYKPIGEGLKSKEHPFKKLKVEEAKRVKKSVNAEKSRIVKRALKDERDRIKSIGGRGTIGSGRVYGDGDGYIEIGGERYYIEYKKRFNGKNLMGPTREEVSKGMQQGVSIYIIDSEEMGGIVSMSLDTFKRMIW